MKCPEPTKYVTGDLQRHRATVHTITDSFARPLGKLSGIYSVRSNGPGRHKSFTHIEHRVGTARGLGALNPSPHS